MSEKKIPVMSIVGVSLRRVFLHFPQTLRVLGPYWLTLIVLLLVQSLGAGKLLGSPLLPLFALTLAASMMIVMGLGLRLWLRTTLFGRSATTGGGIDGRPISAFKFLLRFAILQILIVVLPLTFIAAAFAPDGSQNEDNFGQLLVWLVAISSSSLVIGYFWLRLGLVFPAMAANHPLSFRQAWTLSTGNGLRMVAGATIIALLCFLVMLPSMVVVGILIPPFDGPDANPAAAALIPFFVGSLFIHVGAAIVTSALAYYYRILSNHPNPLAIVK